MKNLKPLIVLLLVLATASPVLAKGEKAPSDVVRAFYAQLTETMKQGPQLGFEGRYKKLEPAVKAAFNLPYMARLAVGPVWAATKPDDQQKLVEAFSNFSVANYANNFKKYDGEKFEVLGEKPATGGGVIVETRLVPKDEAPVMLNYLVRADEKGAPRIVDVFLDATISELATRRSEFSSIIKRDGFGALVTSLNDKTKKMGEQ